MQILISLERLQASYSITTQILEWDHMEAAGQMHKSENQTKRLLHNVNTILTAYLHYLIVQITYKRCMHPSARYCATLRNDGWKELICTLSPNCKKKNKPTQREEEISLKAGSQLAGRVTNRTQVSWECHASWEKQGKSFKTNFIIALNFKSEKY